MPALIGIVLASSLCLLIAALVVFGKSPHQVRSTRGVRRLSELLARHEEPNANSAPAASGGWVPSWFDRYLQRAGLPAAPPLYGLLLLPAPAIFMLTEFFAGAIYAVLLTGVAYPLLLSSVLQWRIRRHRQKIVAQLPGFLESVARILSVGCSLELAFRNATEECDEPLHGIVAQILLRTRAGQSLEDAMTQVADIYAIRELGFVASIFHIGIRYGGNAQAVLERLSMTIRERQRGQQELKAMTAETRASAWILSALPVFVATLMLMSNPNYLLGMWGDPAGRQILLAAAGLQVAGVLLLLRMSRID